MKILVDFFSKRDHWENTSLRLKFPVTSRPYDDPELGFQPISNVGTFIHLDGDE